MTEKWIRVDKTDDYIKCDRYCWTVAELVAIARSAEHWNSQKVKGND
jgi:hypothetical protein